MNDCAMSFEVLSALILFALVSSITPGPNNLMLMASGANFGFRRTVPHMLGIGFGFVFMLLMVGAGLIRVFDAFPVIYTALKAGAVVYMLYLAWRIANAAPLAEQTHTGTPLNFWQAAAFQWVNPKAWAMALTAISVYTPERTPLAVISVAVVFGAINLPAVSSWTVLGQQMARLLSNPRHLRLFNITMAVLLIASLYPVVLS